MDFNLKKLFEEGFIPAPGEKDDLFFRRVARVKALVASPQEVALSHKLFQKQELIALSPSLLAFKSDRKLPFWTGALTWIISLDDDLSLPLLQLPLKKRTFCLAKEAEIIAHEKIHAMRAAFHEPKYEEMIAYLSSPSRFRRLLGPLFASTTESAFFLATIIASTLFSFPPFFLLFLSALLIRLFFRKFFFSKALKTLSRLFINPKEVVIFLSDAEINRAARGDLNFLRENSLRMRQLGQVFEKGLTDEGAAGY